MANLFAFANWVTMDALRILQNKLEVASSFNTDYSKELKQKFPIGETFNVKFPQRYTVRTGLGYQPQPIDRRTTPVTCNQVFGIDFDWDSVEAALKAERGEAAIREQYIMPAASQLAQDIDSRASLWATLNTPNLVGILGTNPTNTDIAQSARQRMIENACPPGDRKMIVSPGTESGIVNGSTTIFNPTDEISRQYREGSMGRARGFDWYSSMSLYSNTAGTWAGAVTVNGPNQSGTQLLINATAGDTFFQGNVISILGMNNVNPKTRRTTGTVKYLVITQDLVAAGGGVDVLNVMTGPGISGIEGPGSQYQNVDSLPATTAALTLYPGTTAPNGKSGIQGLALHRDAFAMVSIELELPKAVEISSQQRDPNTGVSIRFVKAWDQIQSKMTNRMDVVIGFGNLYNDACAVRVASGT